MNNTYAISQPSGNDNCLLSIQTYIQQELQKAYFSAEKESKEKYEAKAKLIDEATDLSTKEKLDAWDKNYDRRNQERFQIFIGMMCCVGVVSVICLYTCSNKKFVA